jgi:hypothetical protein
VQIGRGVEHGGAGVLVEVLEAMLGRRLGQQVFVFAGEGDGARRRRWAVVQRDEGLDVRELVQQAFDHRRELGIDRQHVRARMLERVEDLLGRQPHVHRHQRGGHHRHREIAFEVAVAVPVHHRHRVAGPDALPCQHVGEPADALAQAAVVVAPEVAVDDLLAAGVLQRGMQQLLDEQRVGVGRRGALDAMRTHVVSPCVRPHCPVGAAAPAGAARLRWGAFRTRMETARP